MDQEKATFAAGCFWGVEEEFSKLPGVISTRVGYAGGKVAKPTYHQVCGKNTGHAEAIEVTFDPTKITYRQLLDTFFSLHNPSSALMQGRENSGQYRSAIFYHDEAQKILAMVAVELLEKSKKFGPKIYTQIVRASIFWEAEVYHQQYYSKRKRLGSGFVDYGFTR